MLITTVHLHLASALRLKERLLNAVSNILETVMHTPLDELSVIFLLFPGNGSYSLHAHFYPRRSLNTQSLQEREFSC